MLELKREQMEDIADAVWKGHKDKIEPILEEKYKEVMKKTVCEKVAEAVGEKDSEIRDLCIQIEELEQRDSENRQIMLSLEEKVRKAESRAMVPLDAHAKPPSAALFRTDMAEVERIDRTSCTVRISTERDTSSTSAQTTGSCWCVLMTARRDCIDNKIVLNGRAWPCNSRPDSDDMEYSPNTADIDTSEMNFGGDISA